MNATDLKEVTDAINNLSSSVQTLNGLIVGLIVVIILAGVLANKLMGTKAKEIGAEGEIDDKKANALFEQKRFSELKQLCEKTVLKYPNSALAHWYLAIVSYQEGDLKSAEERFNLLIGINPSWKPSATPYLEEIYALVEERQSENDQ